MVQDKHYMDKELDLLITHRGAPQPWKSLP